MLCSPTKLERDAGLQELQKNLLTAKDTDIKSFEVSLLHILEQNEYSWNSKLGGLLGIKALIWHLRGMQYAGSAELHEKTVQICLKALVDPEVRVRLEAGQVLGLLCTCEGVQLYKKCRARVAGLIRDSLDHENRDPSSGSEENPETELSDQREGASAAKVLRDTASWRILETSTKCLQAMVEGCGSSFTPCVDRPLIEMLLRTLRHVNRFVRETGFYLLSSLISCCAGCSDENPFSADRFGHDVCRGLASGLADNWSQVRLAASEATRKFLLSFPDDESRREFFPALLPQMCLNRYYTADGVRIYSQETWRRIAKTEGRELVERYIGPVVDYYLLQTKADNHAVREASCTCIAELASKIKPDAVRPHVPQLFRALLACFKDEAWPVRDAACLACGNFILCYPDESRSSLEAVYPLFFENLQDSIPSVRLGAAVALANVARAYGPEALSVVEAKIKEGLAGVAQQPAEHVRFSRAEWGTERSEDVGSVKDGVHCADKQAYPCRPPSPKVGCGLQRSDWKFHKPPEPWELADGCIHLVAELAQIPELASDVQHLLPLVAQAVQHKHYPHHTSLLETMCKQLPNVARGVGKKAFKSHLDRFLAPVFYSLNCENGLTSSAASQCLNQLSSLLGPSILRARVEQWDRRYLQQLDANIHIAGL